MKLLSRTELQKTKGEERRREIEEGVKLARRIDGMRSSIASEENNLEKYRAASVALTLDEIDDVLAKQHLAEQDLVIARAEAARLRQPLDSEWATLHEAIANHEVDKNLVEILKTGIDAKRSALEQREANIDDKEKRIELKNTATDEYKQEAENILVKARETKKESDDQVSRQKEEIAKREAEVTQREVLIASREGDANNRDVKLSARENVVRAEAKRVQDLYQTLMRSQKYGERK